MKIDFSETVLVSKIDTVSERFLFVKTDNQPLTEDYFHKHHL